MKGAYKQWIRTVRQYAKRNGEEIAVSWAMDITFDPSLYKAHLHKHAIVRTTKGSSIDWAEKMFQLWKRAVRNNGGGDVVRRAFYFEKVDTTERASKYLFKSAREAISTQSKLDGFNGRVGFGGLADLVLKASGEHLDRLVHLYRDFLSAIQGSKWYFIAKTMMEDYVEPTPEEEVIRIVEDKEEDDGRIITSMKPNEHFHRALCDSGYLWLLMLVLRTKQDGDPEIEQLRFLIDKYNKKEELFWHSEENYYSVVEAISLWGKRFG